MRVLAITQCSVSGPGFSLLCSVFQFHEPLPGPISTALIDIFSCRISLVTSGCLYAIGYLATAFAPNIEVTIFTCGIIAGGYVFS